MRYTESIENSIKAYPKLKIIDAQAYYSNNFKHIPETTFYKTISRMTKMGELHRISKGIYCKPKQGRFGVTLANEKEILEFYLRENQGVIIGYRLFNKYGITTQIAKNLEIYSRVITQNYKIIKNVKMHKLNLQLDHKTITMIELLEILQEYMNIEDLNRNNLKKYLESAVLFYDEKVIDKILNSMNYKKSTIDSLRNLLDFYEVTHSLNKYLNGTSKYKVLNMESE
jgi:Family of unknown function (DUF6088)